MITEKDKIRKHRPEEIKAPDNEEFDNNDLSDDPWIHRSKYMHCETCMWFVVKSNSVASSTIIGRCRRHAPTMSGYPVVFETDWCGEHKLDENKI